MEMIDTVKLGDAVYYRTRAGDIVLTTSNSWISKAIRYFTRLPGEPKTRFSHAEIVVLGGLLEVAEVVSADGAGIRRRLITPYHQGKRAVIYRPTVPIEARQAAVKKALEMVGRKYPIWRLFMHLLDRLLLGAFLFRRIGRTAHNPECAALVALAYYPSIAFSNVPWWAVSPDDIDDHAIAIGYGGVFDGVLP